jgi:hypothetical protein
MENSLSSTGWFLLKEIEGDQGHVIQFDFTLLNVLHWRQIAMPSKRPRCRQQFAMIIALLMIAPTTARAIIVGPYTADANTVFLFHLDESSGNSVTANAGTAGNVAIAYDGNPIANPATAIGTVLGGTGFAGFGNAANIAASDQGIGFDGNNNGEFNSDTNSTSSADAITHASIVGPTGAFTVEAMFNLPAGQNLDQTRDIIATDRNGGDSTRGMSFRLNNAGRFQFRSVAEYSSSVYVEISNITGTNAFANDTWFHVAYTYDGEGTGKLYWTKVDPSVTEANLVGTFTTIPPDNIDPVPDLNGEITAPLVIGNENRTTSSEGFRGLLDEIRISNVARGPSDFIFELPSSGEVIGDYNNNQIVDSADYVIWRKNLGLGITLHGEDPTVTPNSVTNEDYEVWRSRFGSVTGSGSQVFSSGAQVPEPSTLMLVGGLLLGLIVRMRLVRK